MTAQDPLYRAAVAELLRLMEEATARGERDVSSAALATSTLDGRPSVRTISVVSVREAGIAFFANAQTGKGRQLSVNPRAALCFHWPLLQYQVTIEGTVAQLDDAQSDALWRVTPREVGIGRWASGGTQAAGREDVAERKQTIRRQFEDERIPRAPGWVGYEVRPDRIEIWPTGWQRLRARERYLRLEDGSWKRAQESA